MKCKDGKALEWFYVWLTDDPDTGKIKNPYFGPA